MSAAETEAAFILSRPRLIAPSARLWIEIGCVQLRESDSDTCVLLHKTQGQGGPYSLDATTYTETPTLRDADARMRIERSGVLQAACLAFPPKRWLDARPSRIKLSPPCEPRETRFERTGLRRSLVQGTVSSFAARRGLPSGGKFTVLT